LFIELKKEINPNAIVRGIKKSLFFIIAGLLYLIEMLQPACRAANYRNISFKTLVYITYCTIGGSKFNGYICLFQVLGCKLGGISLIKLPDNLMTLRKSYLFYLFAHFTVPYQCYLHNGNYLPSNIQYA